MGRRVRRFVRAALTSLVALSAFAQAAWADPRGVLDVQYTPAPRAQVAIWLETADGEYVTTLRLTEAVAFRGVGNRPGASQMNSGYRWPYGRREGVLPIWATRRASAPGAALFPRVIFQNRRAEGLASRTATDYSADSYYCLSFDRTGSTRDALDAVSCASVFNSDKGRFLTEQDVESGYGEPYLDPETGEAAVIPLPLHSLYPPRMDVQRCATSGCYDHRDVGRYAEEARAAMPEIDAVTMATPQGDARQSELWSVPADLPDGDYVLYAEVNVEGDYSATFDAARYPTVKTPLDQWDAWATNYGYPYRGQPSVLYEVPLRIAEGERSYASRVPVARSAWGPWRMDYGLPESSLVGITDDPERAPFSGADRLRPDRMGRRLVVDVLVLADAADPEPTPQVDVVPEPPEPSSPGAPTPAPSAPDPTSPEPNQPDPLPSGETTMDAPVVEVMEDPTGSDAKVLVEEDPSPQARAVGMIRGLSLARVDDQRVAHERVRGVFMAAESSLPIHRYEVRVGTEPIVDARTFLENARPAKAASDDPEGATSLQIDPTMAPDTEVDFEIGDLAAQTHYFVAVRAVDKLNRPGPISVAEVSTPERVFTTVTPCFVATAAYGTPLSGEISVLRRFRDRFLLTNAPGRLLVDTYYSHGPAAARYVTDHEGLRRAVRGVLSRVVDGVRSLLAD